MAGPRLLVIDDVGYLSDSNRLADLRFELVSRVTITNSTLVTPTTLRRMAASFFPKPACFFSWSIGLVAPRRGPRHLGESYRLKRPAELSEQRARHDGKAKS